MNIEMAYLIGMILGNGEIQKGNHETIVTIDIPHKNLYTDDFKDVKIYVKASITDIRDIVEPLIGSNLKLTQEDRSTIISFVKPNEEYVMRQILKFVGNGRKHSTMEMNPDLFSMTSDEKNHCLEVLRMLQDILEKVTLLLDKRELIECTLKFRVIGKWLLILQTC